MNTVINYYLAKHLRCKSYLSGVNAINDNSPPQIWVSPFELEYTIVQAINQLSQLTFSKPTLDLRHLEISSNFVL